MLDGSLLKQLKWREGGQLGAATQQEEGRGSSKDRWLWWCLGGRQLAKAPEVSGGWQTGVHGGDPIGEKRGGRAGRPGKERNMGPTQKNSICFDLFKNFSNDFELI
jgi:hypothetical protein